MSKDPSSPRDLLQQGLRLSQSSQGPLHSRDPTFSSPSSSSRLASLVCAAPMPGTDLFGLETLALLAPRLLPQHWGPRAADPHRLLGSRILKPEMGVSPEDRPGGSEERLLPGPSAHAPAHPPAASTNARVQPSPGDWGWRSCHGAWAVTQKIPVGQIGVPNDPGHSLIRSKASANPAAWSNRQTRALSSEV